jgi:hypothetical protein
MLCHHEKRYLYLYRYPCRYRCLCQSPYPYSDNKNLSMFSAVEDQMIDDHQQEYLILFPLLMQYFDFLLTAREIPHYCRVVVYSNKFDEVPLW